MCVALPCRIESITAGEGLSRRAQVSVPNGTVADIDLVMVPEAVSGDFVIVHSGFAISRVSDSSAQATLDILSRPNST